MPEDPTLKALHDIVNHLGPIPDELFAEHSRPLMEVLQERMDDPNYIPTGPTYGEMVKPPTEDETRMAIAQVNFLRGAEQERERCARIAEDWFKDLVQGSAGRKDYGPEIAAKIRSGE